MRFVFSAIGLTLIACAFTYEKNAKDLIGVCLAGFAIIAFGNAIGGGNAFGLKQRIHRRRNYATAELIWEGNATNKIMVHNIDDVNALTLQENYHVSALKVKTRVLPDIGGKWIYEFQFMGVGVREDDFSEVCHVERMKETLLDIQEVLDYRVNPEKDAL